MVEVIERLATASPGDAPDVELRTCPGVPIWAAILRRTLAVEP